MQVLYDPFVAAEEGSRELLERCLKPVMWRNPKQLASSDVSLPRKNTPKPHPGPVF